MKQCPVCRSTYTDDSLVFCLNDGGKLFSPSAAVTQEMSFGDRQTHSVERKTIGDFPSAPTVVVQKKSKSVNLIIISAIFVFIGLLMGGIWLTRYYVLQRNAREAELLKAGRDVNEGRTDDETRELREKLDRLEKQVERQKAANKTVAPTNTPSTPVNNDASVSGTVDSPNDGFLALRSAPNHKTGAQILQIPHGAVIFVFNCQNTTTVADRRGRWCRTTYGGKTGWVFDGFLIY